MPDSIAKELSSAYAQLAELQTKIDEDDYIIELLQSSTYDDDNHSTRCDGYDAALEIIVARRKDLDGELRIVKEQIVEIEEKWTFWAR